MARPKAKAPSLRYHISGQSVVTIDGRDFYLGPHDTPKSLARYAVLISLYQAGGLQLPDGLRVEQLDQSAAVLTGATQATHQIDHPLTVRHLTANYREHVKMHHVGNPAELHRIGQVCDSIDKHDGDRLADDYGPLALQRQRKRWIDAGNSRAYCNRLTNAVIRMFRHGTSRELCKPET